jgi:hypothetical protein
MIARRLREIHSGLHLRFVQGTWGVCLTWTDGDTRRQWIRNESYDPAQAYDIIGYLPMDCPPDSAPAYLTKMFREFPREDVNRMLDAMEELNAQPAQAAVEAAIADVLDSADPSQTAPKRRGRPPKVR